MGVLFWIAGALFTANYINSEEDWGNTPYSSVIWDYLIWWPVTLAKFLRK